jgi:hypothetical protein
MVHDSVGQMSAQGVYGQHSLAQHSAGNLGLPLLRRAVEAVAPGAAARPFVIVADLGVAGGRNELEPLGLVVRDLRARGVDGSIVMVHTDIPSNDFSELFTTIRDDPRTYLKEPDVYSFAAGRSFYEQIFPPGSVTVAWTAIAVHWLSRVPQPVRDHVYCSFATGSARDALRDQAEVDWNAFLKARGLEIHPGGQLVVVGGAASDDGASGAEALMDALNMAVRDAVRSGLVAEDEYLAMTIPTWNRTVSEYASPFREARQAADLPAFDLVEQVLVEVPDRYFANFRSSHDVEAFASAVSEFLRAFTEPSLIGVLARSPADRSATADFVYSNVRSRIARDPASFETNWRVVLMRLDRIA